jgi:hypothetical protein
LAGGDGFAGGVKKSGLGGGAADVDAERGHDWRIEARG